MKLDYNAKVLKAISLAETGEDIDLIIEKISTTDSINRRTPAGRELTEELRNLCLVRARELIDNGEEPF